MRLIIVSVLFGLTAQLVMKENVIFQKVKEVTTVRARWMVTFVEDLLPFERFLNKTQNTTVPHFLPVIKMISINTYLITIGINNHFIFYKYLLYFITLPVTIGKSGIALCPQR
jgi:hypothetical protein